LTFGNNMNLEKSLQAMKNDIAKIEETLKVLQKSYPHLANLSKKQLLTYFNVNTIQELNGYIKRIKESQELHDNLTVQENKLCSCTDSNGQTKDLYYSEVSAQAQLNKLPKEKKSPLRVYICLDGCGWHLTKG